MLFANISKPIWQQKCGRDTFLRTEKSKISIKVRICDLIIVLLHTIVIRNGKINWKHEPYCFRLNLKYLGWPYRAYIKTAKSGDICEKLLSVNDFEAILATYCCYHNGAKAAEAVQKIATNQKVYLKSLSYVTICWIAKIYISINNSEKRLVTISPPM